MSRPSEAAAGSERRPATASPSITDWLATCAPAESAGEHVQRLLHFHILQRQQHGR